MLNKKKLQKWDNFYENEKSHYLLRKINSLYFCKIFQREFLKIVKKTNNNILEAGCGEGAIGLHLANLGFKVTLLDLSDSALNQTKMNFHAWNLKGNFVKGDIFNMDFPSNHFDAVWNQGVLEHFSNAEEAIKEMFRVTKKRGYVVVFVPAKYSPLDFSYRLLRLLGLESLWPWDEQMFYTKKLLYKQMLNATGRKPIVKRIFLSWGFSMAGYIKK